MDPHRSICGTVLSIDDVERALREELGSQSRVGEWAAEEVGRGEGFLSCMARITLKWNPADPHLPSSVMLKIPTGRNLEVLSQGAGKDDMMSDFDNNLKASLDKLHNTEVILYELLKKEKYCPVSLAKIYKAKRMGEEGPAYILMEDLSQVASCKDMITGPNFQQLKQVFEQIGALQAWSLKNEHWKLEELPMTLLNVMGGNEEQLERNQAQFFEELKGREWVERLGQHLVDKLPKLRVSAEAMRKHIHAHRQLGLPDVLVHGDFWNNNLLMRKDSNGEPNGDLMAIIDWQASHPGSPAEDFIRLMTTSVNYEVRRKHEKELLEIYYASLERHLGAVPPFSLEQFKRAYESMMVCVVGLQLPMMSSIFKMVQQGGFKNMDPVKGMEALKPTFRALLEDTLQIIEK